jgi:hypothetical protein
MNEVQNLNSEFEFEEQDFNFLFDIYFGHIYDLKENFVPIIEKRVKTAEKVKYINSEIIKLMNERDYCKKLYEKSVKSGQMNDDLWLKYKELRTKTLKSIRKAKIAKILEDQQNQEIKKWKVLKTLIPTKSSEKSIRNDFSSVEINASDFNQHFINTPIELTKNIYIEPTQESLKVDLLTDKTFSLLCISTEEVTDIMMKMDSKKAVVRTDFWFVFYN